YGIIAPSKLSERIYQVIDLVEKPHIMEAPSNLAIMGRYVLMPEIFKALEDTPPGRNREIQLTDAFKQLLKYQQIYAYEFEGERYDAGTPFGLLKTTIGLMLENHDIGPQLREYLRKLL
ncbi:sugar phosphate nucleotidyltransferase, partial [Chloroflexota bacterium]